MELVVDTSIVFSLFKSNSFTNSLLANYNLKLFAPKQLIEELMSYSELICSKAGISKETFLFDLHLLSELIELKTPSEIFVDKASEIILDMDDVSFLALAMELDVPIWSNDDHFKEQKIIEVFTTKELVNILKNSEN